MISSSDELDKELRFKTARSSGPGGQNVNKVESKVELYWNVLQSTVLDEDEKALIIEKLINRINKDGELILSAQTNRSQLRNKEEVILRFYVLLNAALKKQKPRKVTKPSRASVQRRIDRKKKIAQNKKLRQKPKF